MCMCCAQSAKHVRGVEIEHGHVLCNYYRKWTGTRDKGQPLFQRHKWPVQSSMNTFRLMALAFGRVLYACRIFAMARALYSISLQFAFLCAL
jgi:hypothetical protein